MKAGRSRWRWSLLVVALAVSTAVSAVSLRHKLVEQLHGLLPDDKGSPAGAGADDDEFDILTEGFDPSPFIERPASSRR